MIREVLRRGIVQPTTNMDEKALRELAAQLRQPEGEKGIQVGRQMEQTNAFMISATIHALALQPDEQVLEIGFGNGSHVHALLQATESVVYTGIDISAQMLQEAQSGNEQWINTGRAVFRLTDGKQIPFTKAAFDAVFTVNTLYFWEDATAYIAEILRVLRTGGRACITYALESFMQQLPFTDYGFTLYSNEKVEQLLQQAGAVNISSALHTEHVQGNAGQTVERTFAVTSFLHP